MKYILDTHAFLWWIGDHDDLSDTARGNYRRSGKRNILQCCFRLGNRHKNKEPENWLFQDKWDEFIESNIRTNNFLIMPINLAHSILLRSLPNTHRDPFDQMLASPVFA